MATNIEKLSVNTIRALAADVVQKANSGHPGMPMGMAPIGHALWARHLKYSPKSPLWWNRDRFLLSNGHGCALQYVLLHLAGYNVTLDDLKRFRQIGSNTPGHPEVHMTPGVEVTTGPLGQGIANGVGLAIAQENLAAIYNKQGFKLFDNYTYVFLGDGCLQEGVASEAVSIAGHLKLKNLIMFYDDNHITIDGDTKITFTEDVQKRFESYGFDVLRVQDANDDVDALSAVIDQAKKNSKPTLVILPTIIGFGSKKQGTEGVHGAPLGEDDITQLKQKLGLSPEKFHVPSQVADFWQQRAQAGAQAEAQWNELLNNYAKAFPKEFEELKQRFSANKLPADFARTLPKYDGKSKADATRNTSGVVLAALGDTIPALIGGSADLTGSNKTEMKKWHDFQSETPDGRYIRYGVREHAMIAINNGLYAYGAHIPFGATFLNFIEYGFPSVRLAALSNFQQLLIMTHDSIGLGEDGPTHQPVEALTLCRATPNTLVFRPADGAETVGSYLEALKHIGPSVICGSRQNLPSLEKSTAEKVAQGGYVVHCDSATGTDLNLIFIATGSEVGETLKAAASISAKGLKVRVVSMPCVELFARQPVEYRRSVLPIGVPVISVEAAAITGWEKYAHASIGMTTFGASAPLNDVLKRFSLDAAGIEKRAQQHLAVLAEFTNTNGGKAPPLNTHFDFHYETHQSQHAQGQH